MSSSTFRDSLYTVDDEGKRRWVYAHVVRGKYYTIRALVSYLLLAIYLLTPWFDINSRQAVLFDIPNRKFILFGTEFWATDTFYLMLILGLLAMCLFFFTSLFGRVWCGWACPETVFLEFLFRPIENLIEGSANERRRLDQAPWTPRKIFKKLLKHALCAFFAGIISLTFLAYFVGSRELSQVLFSGPLEQPFAYGVLIFLMAVMAFQFGWFREQFCTVLCPYARFQSVLMDEDSLIIGYDAQRGEPRGKFEKQSRELRSHGDCVDCGLCVRVCPTGIDIRNGVQLECIACAECADACDSVMLKINRPTGLVRYDTLSGLAGNPRRFFRPRVIVYAGILLLFIGLLIGSLERRVPADFQILRPLGKSLYETLPDGRLSNRFEVHLANKSSEFASYEIRLDPQGSDSELPELIVPVSPYPVQAGQMAIIPIFIKFQPSAIYSESREGKKKVTISLWREQEMIASQNITLLGPGE